MKPESKPVEQATTHGRDLRALDAERRAFFAAEQALGRKLTRADKFTHELRADGEVGFEVRASNGRVLAAGTARATENRAAGHAKAPVEFSEIMNGLRLRRIHLGLN